MTSGMPADAVSERAFKNLRFLAAPRATVTVGSYDAEYQICQITFARRDGSIFVQFPYLGKKAGLLSIARFPADQSGSVTLAFGEHAKTTSHLAKYSHHPDGVALFSQDGKVKSEVRRESFRLDGPLGHLFQLHAYHPSGFTRFDQAKRRAGRAYLRNVFQDRLPGAVTIRAEWRRKQSIVDNIQPLGGVSGPLSRVESRLTGERFMVHFLGAPEGYPLQEHVLMVTVAPTVELASFDEPSIVFLGGYDHHEVAETGMSAHQTSCLLALYPIGAHAELASRVQSIDFIPPAR